jgi:hypothetical protein
MILRRRSYRDDHVVMMKGRWSCGDDTVEMILWR